MYMVLWQHKKGTFLPDLPIGDTLVEHEEMTKSISESNWKIGSICTGRGRSMSKKGGEKQRNMLENYKAVWYEIIKGKAGKSEEWAWQNIEPDLVKHVVESKWCGDLLSKQCRNPKVF